MTEFRQQAAGGGPQITFIMAAFNAEPTIDRAIESVFGQTIRDWELIVIDDGSTDGTARRIAAFAATDSRVRVEVVDHAGTARARNIAVSMATSDYVAFIDADDEVLASYLAVVAGAICTQPEYDAYVCNALIIRTAEPTRFSNATVITEFGLQDFLGGCVVPIGGAVVRRDSFVRVGGFRSDCVCEDYDFWLRMTFEHGRVLLLPEVQYVYHQESGDGRSSDHIAGVDDAVVALGRLVERSRTEAPGLTATIMQAVQDKRVLASEVRRQRQLHEQARSVRATVARLVGERSADRIARFASRHARLVRPIRLALLRLDRGRR